MIYNDLNLAIAAGVKYKVIYTDPPWSFKTYSDKGMGKSPDMHYGTMDLDGIKALPVSQITEKDCIMFMWVYNPMLPQSFELMKAWGFEFKSVGFVWNKLTKHGKEAFGTGYYTRQNVELCLIATRGKPGLPKSRSIRQGFKSPLREHSRKPDQVATWITEMYDGPRLEMFSRTERVGYDSFGNECDKFESKV